MYSLKTKIDNVHSYSIDKEDYAVNLKNGDSLINNIITLPLVKEKKIKLNLGNIVSYEKLKTVYSKDLNNKIVLEKNEFIIPQAGKNDFFIAKGDLNLETFVIDFSELYTIKHFKKKKKITFSEKISEIILVDDTSIIYKPNSSNLTLLDNQGLLKWTLNLEEYLDSEISENNRFKYLAKTNDTLFLSCPNHILISVDIFTGKILNKWKEISGINKGAQIEGLIPNSESFVVDNEQSKLIGAFHKYYIEIDFKNNQIKYLDISDELKKHSIFFIKQTNEIDVTDSHMYITAMMEQNKNDSKFSYDCLILLNKKTLKIDWIYKFNNSPLGTNKPRLLGNKLFQLDTENTLYIFEKE